MPCVFADEIQALPTLERDLGYLRLLVRGMRDYLWASLRR